MADLTVIVPSRGRPGPAAELAETFAATCTANTRLVFAVGADDPTLSDYRPLAGPDVEVYAVKPVDRPSTMVHNLNEAAADVASRHGVLAVGFMGDDHRPRTVGWDAVYLEALRHLGAGIVYGDDLLQGFHLPTQVAMSASIVRTLGHMAPSALWHLYCDNYWRDLGEAADCLVYLPGVVVEHLHPIAGKSKWTPGHVRVNAPDMYQHDGAVYAAYRATRLGFDADKIRALRGVPVAV